MREKSTKEYCNIFDKEKEKSTLNMKRGEFEDNKSCGAEKEEKWIRKGRDQRVCVFMSFREKSDMPTKSISDLLVELP